MISNQSTKIFYLIAEGHNYNAKLAKFLKRSKATLNSQLNELKKAQLIEGIKKPGNVTEYRINFDKLAELITAIIKETDQKYTKQKTKKEEPDLTKIEKSFKTALNSDFFQKRLKEHFAFCANQNIAIERSLEMFLKAVSSLNKDEIKRLDKDKAKIFLLVYPYARTFSMEDMLFNPIYILKQKILSK